MAERGKKLSGALRNDPKNKPTERLSPGVYRSAGGGLVTKGGRPIERSAPQTNPQSGVLTFNNPSTVSNGMIMLPPGSRSNNAQMDSFFQNLPQGDPAKIAGMVANDAAFQGNPFANDPSRNMDIVNYPMQIDPGFYNPMSQKPFMPQPSANMGGQYRLSPGVYGTREQAMRQYEQQMQQRYQPMTMPQVRKG
jgi:hypothetical protein